MVMEWNVPGTIHQSEKLNTKDACMKYFYALKPFYLETDAAGVGLGAGLLQVREGVNCGCYKAPDNVILCPTAFASKSLSSMEQWYRNI